MKLGRQNPEVFRDAFVHLSDLDTDFAKWRGPRWFQRNAFCFETNAVMNLFILRGSPGCLLRSEAVPSSIYDLIGSERIASYCWRIVRGQ